MIVLNLDQLKSLETIINASSLVIKSDFFVRFEYSPTQQKIDEYQQEYEYLQKITDKLNKINFNYICKDSHFFYIFKKDELETETTNYLNTKLKEYNKNKSKAKENITIRFKDLLKSKDLIDAFIDAKETEIKKAKETKETETKKETIETKKETK